MLRTNLSTRPFYNERAVHVALGLAALVVLALTAVNLVEVVRLSRQNTGLAAHIRDDRSAADDLSRRARQIRQGIDQNELKVVVAAAQEANALIDGRTFSWTALFNQLESTLPPEVMLASVRPKIDDGATTITMIVLGRRTVRPRRVHGKTRGHGRVRECAAAPAEPERRRPDAGDNRGVICSRGAAGRHDSAGPAREGGRGWRGRRPMTIFRRVLAEKRGLIYPLIGAVLLNAAVFIAVVYPLSLKVANGERDAQAASRARATAQAEFDRARATVSGKASADAELKKFYSAVLPPDQSAARRIIYGKIDKLASTASVKPGQETFAPSQERGSQLGKLTATVVLMGEYRNIRRFIHDLETAPEFLILENVALSQTSERDRGLTVVVKVATYFRIGNDGN